SLMLGFIASWIGYSLCIAHEASGHLTAMAKRKLLQLYSCKRIEQGLQNLLFFLKDYNKHNALKQKYQEAPHKIEDQREETIHLLYKIQKFGTVEASYRELLFNQALAEMNDKLQYTLQSF